MTWALVGFAIGAAGLSVAMLGAWMDWQHPGPARWHDAFRVGIVAAWLGILLLVVGSR